MSSGVCTAQVSIDVGALLELTTDLIRIPTVNPTGEQAAVLLLASALDREGIDYVIEEDVPHRPNLIVEMGDGDGPTVWLNGHLDTVPIGSRLAWRHEPFGGDLVDGRIYGRGASDNKGGVAAMVHAAIALHRADVPLHGQLRLTAVMGEEEGQIGMRHLLDLGVTADAFVSSQWSTARQIAVGYRGLCWVEVTTRGRTAHGSRPSSGINAIEQMVDHVLPALRNLQLSATNDAPVKMPDFSVNLACLSGGDAPNIVPDRCRATLDFRLANGQRSDQVRQAIEQALARLCAADPLLSVDSHVLVQAEPFQTDPECDLVRMLARAVLAVTGEAPRYFGKTGTGEANLVRERLHIPVVAYGPGNDSGHSPDEYIGVGDLGQVCEVYTRLAIDYLGGDRPTQERRWPV